MKPKEDVINTFQISLKPKPEGERTVYEIRIVSNRYGIDNYIVFEDADSAEEAYKQLPKILPKLDDVLTDVYLMTYELLNIKPIRAFFEYAGDPKDGFNFVIEFEPTSEGDRYIWFEYSPSAGFVGPFVDFYDLDIEQEQKIASDIKQALAETNLFQVLMEFFNRIIINADYTL